MLYADYNFRYRILSFQIYMVKNSAYKRVVLKVKNVYAYNPGSCFFVPDESFGVFSRV